LRFFVYKNAIIRGIERVREVRQWRTGAQRPGTRVGARGDSPWRYQKDLKRENRFGVFMLPYLTEVLLLYNLKNAEEEKMIAEDSPLWHKPDAEWKCASCLTVFQWKDRKELSVEWDEDDCAFGCPECDSEDIFPNDPAEWGECEEEKAEEERRQQIEEEFIKNNFPDD